MMPKKAIFLKFADLCRFIHCHFLILNFKKKVGPTSWNSSQLSTWEDHFYYPIFTSLNIVLSSRHLQTLLELDFTFDRIFTLL